MVQAREPSARIDDDTQRVEAHGGPPGAIGHLGQERGGHRADLTLLGLSDSHGVRSAAPARRVLTSQKTSVEASQTTRSSSP